MGTSRCCPIFLDYGLFQKKLGGLQVATLKRIDPTPEDRAITETDWDSLSNTGREYVQKLKLAYRIPPFSFCFHVFYPERYQLSRYSEEELQAFLSESGSEKEGLTSVAQKILEVSRKVTEENRALKQTAGETGQCYASCFSASVRTAQLLLSKGISAKMMSSRRLLHFWVEVSIGGVTYILDPTADQFNAATVGDPHQYLGMVLIPRKEVSKNFYLQVLYGSRAEYAPPPLRYLSLEFGKAKKKIVKK